MKLSPNPRPFRFSLGDRGEAVACEFLRKQGFEIIEKNYQCKLGEIDVIAKRNGRIVFVEIKTRSSGLYGYPQEAVDKKKQEKILKLAEWYLKEKEFSQALIAFHVVAVIWNGEGKHEIRLIENAFEKEAD